MNNNQFPTTEVSSRDRAATFGGQPDTNFGGNSNEGGPTSQSFEAYLTKYEYLRLNYENEGISQSSLLLLRRLSKSFHDNDPTLSNLPILKEMVMVCKKLMLNDFEILIWAIYLKETVMNRNDFIDYLSTSAMFVKKDLNENDVFKIFETFFAHNHYDTYAKYASSSKPQVTLTLKRINYYNMTLLAPFEERRDKEVQDFNYEVDALEDEHVRREVHTTKVVIDEENEGAEKGDKNDGNYTETVAKNNKRTRKTRTRTQPVAKVAPQPMQPVQAPIEHNVPTQKIKAKREHKKSFDFLNGDDKSDHVSESPFPSMQKFPSLLNRSPQLPSAPAPEKKQPLLFSQIEASVKKPEEKTPDSIYPFGNSSGSMAPTINAPFNNRPKPSLDSIGGGMGAFEQIDDHVGFASREFMLDKSQEPKNLYNSFKVNFNPFASGEFGRSIEPNDMPRNLIHPTPKYQK